MHFNNKGFVTSETDRNGNTVTMGRSAEGRLESVSDPASRKLTFSYNVKGLVESVKDPMGHTVKYVYEGDNLASVTEPEEGSPRWKFEYDVHHQLTKTTDGRGNTVTTTYDESNRVTSQTDGMGRERKWKYEALGSGTETMITEPSGVKTHEQFNNKNLPISITHAYGTPSASTTIYGYNEQGYLLSLTDPDGHKTSYTYDEAGDRTGETDALGHKKKWTYNSGHDVISATTPNGETTTIERDVHGNAELDLEPLNDELQMKFVRALEDGLTAFEIGGDTE